MSANVVKLEELGHGATGSVYKAVHATTLQILAVKEVKTVDRLETSLHPIEHVASGRLARIFRKNSFSADAHTML